MDFYDGDVSPGHSTKFWINRFTWKPIYVASIPLAGVKPEQIAAAMLNPKQWDSVIGELNTKALELAAGLELTRRYPADVLAAEVVLGPFVDWGRIVSGLPFGNSLKIAAESVWCVFDYFGYGPKNGKTAGSVKEQLVAMYSADAKSYQKLKSKFFASLSNVKAKKNSLAFKDTMKFSSLFESIDDFVAGEK